MAIGHVRYSTTGGGSWENAQPVWRDDGRELALAHNGNLTNAVELWGELKERGIAFRGTSDSEIIAALLSSHDGKLIEDAVADVMPRLEGAYSTVVMTKRAIVAFRDPHGVRPLSLGRLDDRFVVASESCAFDIIGAELMREVHPGEMVSLTERGLETRQVVKAERPATCVFEHIYFSRPDSRLEGKVLQQVRGRMGEILWREAPVEADLVISVPDSGNPAAAGFARASGLPARRRPDQEPLRGADLHPARPGAAQARPAAQVQPAAGDRRRPAHRRRRRLDRARQHDAADRRHAARRRRARGAPADLGAADPQPLPLRRRHVDPRGDDRPQAHGRRRSPTSSTPTRSPTSRWTASTRRSAPPPEDHCDACFSGRYPLGDPKRRTGSSRWRMSPWSLPPELSSLDGVYGRLRSRTIVRPPRRTSADVERDRLAGVERAGVDQVVGAVVGRADRRSSSRLAGRCALAMARPGARAGV